MGGGVGLWLGCSIVTMMELSSFLIELAIVVVNSRRVKHDDGKAKVRSHWQAFRY